MNCTTTCNIRETYVPGFNYAKCITCGRCWEDGEEIIVKPQNNQPMNRKHHCHACAYLRLGVKTRIMPDHTCETIPPIRVSNLPENANNRPESSGFLQKNEAQTAEITDPITREILVNSGMHV